MIGRLHDNVFLPLGTGIRFIFPLNSNSVIPVRYKEQKS